LSWPDKEDYFNNYFKTLNTEILYWAERLAAGCKSVTTVFIGGGTPSFVPFEYVAEIMKNVQKYFYLDNDCEITMEINPGTVKDSATFYNYFESGINRLSFGLQAWDEKTLKTLGRIHSKTDFLINYESARKVGFKNINADIIFGVPDQDFQTFTAGFKHVVQLGLQHISAYSLIVEPETPFYNVIAAGILPAPDEDIDRDIYAYILDNISSYGLEQYEISNFCKPGFECKHNLGYWQCGEYVGMGLGAHSYYDSVRFSNLTDMEEYITAGNSVKNDSYPISDEEKMNEFMMLGFRLTKGPDFGEFSKIFGISAHDIFGDKFYKLFKQGLIEECETGYRLSRRGLDIANLVFMEFISE
jgi:oxygen-independent coproporphyrinogen-3 oxidase